MEFQKPISSFSAHVYYDTHTIEENAATDLHRRVMKDFYHLRTSKMFPAARIPHPKGRFDVSLSNPIHIAEFLPWILLNRGNLSVLIHPNTGRAVEDFTTHAMWAGDRLHVDQEALRKIAGEQQWLTPYLAG